MNISRFKVNIIKPLDSHRSATAKPLRIGILAYPGCMGTHVFGVSEILRIGLDIAGAMAHEGGPGDPPFDVQIIGVRGRSVRIAGGIAVGVAPPVGRYDLLIVSGLEVTRDVNWTLKLAPLSRELAFIQKAFASGTTVASACVGAFLLGEAGLLNGRAATTAWLFAPELKVRYPAIKLQADAVFLEDSAVITTGAVSSAFDLALHVVKRYLGAEVATATARVALLPGQRASQAPFVDRELRRQSFPTFSHHLTQWFEARLTERYDLQTVAKAFHVSPSTMMRRTKVETGKSPLALLQCARVEKARQLLLTTAWGMERITEQVGYSDPTTFSRLFCRLMGETPARYRRRHRAP